MPSWIKNYLTYSASIAEFALPIPPVPRPTFPSSPPCKFLRPGLVPVARDFPIAWAPASGAESKVAPAAGLGQRRRIERRRDEPRMNGKPPPAQFVPRRARP